MAERHTSPYLLIINENDFFFYVIFMVFFDYSEINKLFSAVLLNFMQFFVLCLIKYERFYFLRLMIY